MKKTALIIAALIIALSVTGCGQEPINSTAAQPVTETSALTSSAVTENTTPYSETTPEQTELVSEVTELSEQQAPPETLPAETTPTATVTTAAPVTTTAATVATVQTTTAAVTTTPVITTTPAATTTIATTTAATTTAAVTTTAPAVQPYSGTTNSYKALNYPTQYGMWISYLEFMRILKGKSEAEFMAEVRKMYDNCAALGINTVYVHASAFGDSFYQSDYYPWSKNVSGTIGVDPGFDPYSILVNEAHSRGLSFHAWINPTRTYTDAEMASLSNNFIVKKWYNDTAKRGKYIVKVNGIWYLNPAYDEVKTLIGNVCREIIVKYNVDGFQIDDYFYPTTENYFDESAFKASGATDRNAWRLNVVSSMVKSLYTSAKSANSSVVFGISPQGNISNNYNFQMADVKKWLAEPGYCDYMIPQLYYAYNVNYLPYDAACKQWCELPRASGVKLITGLAAYKIGYSGDWTSMDNILAKQMQTFTSCGGTGGAAFFRYDFMFCPSAATANKMHKELDAIGSLI